MAAASAYDGRVFVADTSAWSHASHPHVRAGWAAAVRNRQIATCPIVNLEVLYSARDGASFDGIEGSFAVLRDVPVTRSVTNAAIAAYRQLAHRQPLVHRQITFGDLLIAACAQDAAIGVLHYDHHFDLLAQVLAFESRWIAPAGSL